MRNSKLFTIILFILFLGTTAIGAETWLNDLKSLYASKQAVIYEINIRTFGAKDKDGNGIITGNEERGNFINAIRGLDDLASAGVNTIKLMPVLPVGKTHALGTAGSLFAPVEFNKINPQLKTLKGNSVYNEMSIFVKACHKRKIRVIVDLPCCAGYDLYSRNPKLFMKDISGGALAPVESDDVRVLNAQNEEVYNLYKTFVLLMHDLDVDGIAVQMPETKPYTFWKKLITEARKYDSEMLFLAELNPNSKVMFKDLIPITSKTQLLDAGFDGYSGDYKYINDIKTDLFEFAKNDIQISNKYNDEKAAFANFASYDNVSPVITKGADYTKQLMWLTAALPVNLYYIDGFNTGDNYMYPLSNKKASFSLTDNKYYYMKRGQIDIYNFSRKPEGNNLDLYSESVLINKFKLMLGEILAKGSFTILKTSNQNVLAYARTFNDISVLIIANTEKSEFEKIKIKVPKINQNVFAIPIKDAINVPTISKGEIVTNLAPLETQVLLFQNFSIK